MAFTQDAGCRFAGRSHCLYRINVHVSLPGPGCQMPVCQIKSSEYSCGFYSGRRMPVRRQIPLSSQNQCSSSFTRPRTPDAGSPDKIIGIFLWLLLRTPDAGSPADPIVFTESMFMFLYPAQDARCRFAR